MAAAAARAPRGSAGPERRFAGPRARSLPTAGFGRRMLPGSECYTYTFHSRHDSADLIHPRSPRCHWPGVTSGGGGASAAPIHNPPAGGAVPARRRERGGRAGRTALAGDRRCLFCSRREAPASPSDRPGLAPGLGCASSLREPAPPRGGGWELGTLAFPGPRCLRRPGRPQLPAGSASPSLQRAVCGFLERMLENGAVGRARGVGEDREVS